MEKRVLLAFLLSALVLAAWSYFFAPPPLDQPPKSGPSVAEQQPLAPTEREASQSGPAAESNPKTPPESTAAQRVESPASPTRTPLLDLPQRAERLIQVETPYYRITFSNRGAVAVSWTIKKIKTGPRREILGTDGKELELIPQIPDVLQHLGAPFGLVVADEPLSRALNTTTYAVSDERATIHLRESDTRELVFSLHGAGVDVQKKFVFHGDRFDSEYSVEVRQAGKPLEVETILCPNFGDQSVTETGAYVTGPQVVADVAESIKRISADKASPEELSGPVNWICVEDNYFALALVPQTAINRVDVRTSVHTVLINGIKTEKHFIAAVAPTPSGQTHTFFGGPKDPQVLAAIGLRLGRPSLEHIINYGMLTSAIKPIINHVLQPALNFTYRFIPNYGVVILLITFIVNMIFLPLKWRGSVKMKKSQAMQPKMKEVQRKMKGLKKDDPEFLQLQSEQIKLMREANPLGGCLPMLAQMPIFWAFFIFLRVSIDVRQAPFFGWIDNLSAPDKLNLLGNEIHILPIAMCLSWMAQTFVMPSAAPVDPSQRAQQRIQKVLMGLVMPVVFTVFFFWKAPSGLVLYWMFNSLVGAGQQVFINRMTHAPPAEEPKAGVGKRQKHGRKKKRE